MIIQRIRYGLAYLGWALQLPKAAMDPSLVKGEDLTEQERKLIDRHDARRPKPEDYGLGV